MIDKDAKNINNPFMHVSYTDSTVRYDFSYNTKHPAINLQLQIFIWDLSKDGDAKDELACRGKI